MPNFTKGPWLPLCQGSAFVIKSTDNQYIASVDSQRDDNMANATLISWAPDMLEELKRIEREGCEDFQRVQLRDLIAKAEGKSNA